MIDLGLDQGLGQTELGDPVHEDSAGYVQGLEDGDIVTQPGQVAGTRKAGRPGADHSHLVAI